MTDKQEFFSMGSLSDDDDDDEKDEEELKKEEERKKLEEEKKKEEERKKLEEKKKKEEDSDLNALKSNFLERRRSIRVEHKKKKSLSPIDNNNKKVYERKTVQNYKESPLNKEIDNKLNINSIKINSLENSPIKTINKDENKEEQEKLKFNLNAENTNKELKTLNSNINENNNNIIQHLINENLEEQNKIIGGKIEFSQIQAKTTENDSDSIYSSLSSSLSENIEKQIDILVENDNEQNNSFLKQMLIETNKHYIKDQNKQEEKLQNCAVRVIYNIIHQKINFIRLKTYLLIKFWKGNLKKNSGKIFFQCYETYQNRNKQIVLFKYFSRFKIKTLNVISKTKRIIDLIKSLEINNNNINDARTISREIVSKITEHIKREAANRNKKNIDTSQNKLKEKKEEKIEKKVVEKKEEKKEEKIEKNVEEKKEEEKNVEKKEEKEEEKKEEKVIEKVEEKVEEKKEENVEGRRKGRR